MATMNISLPEKMKAFVEKQVADGDFGNASDYVRDVIRRDRERREAIADTKQALAEGEASGFVPFDPDEFLKHLLTLEPRSAV